MKKMRQLLAILLAGTMVAGLTACGGGNGGNDTQTPSTQGGQETGNNNENGNDTPLVVSAQNMSEKFSPFFATTVPDQNIADMTSIPLVSFDRAGAPIYEGIDGYTAEWNGTEYTYYTPSNVTITENADGTVYYDFKIKDDLKFSDGVEVTADDAIFSFYVNCDPTYDGSASTASLPIEGMQAYRSGMSSLASLIGTAGEDNTDFTLWTEEQQNAFWAAINDGGAAFAQEIVDYCVENGYVADASDVAGAAAAWGFALDAGATAKDFIVAIGNQYGWNFADMEAETAGTSLESLIPEDVYAYNTQGIATGEAAPNISGIQKIDDKNFRVVLTEVDATAIVQFSMAIAPLHYYGDESLYDYDNNQFGFPKGDLSIVRSKTTTPLGAGPYKFVKYENKIAYLEANEYYFKGEPLTKNLQFKETQEADNIPGVIQGTIDISDVALTKERIAQIEESNGNGDLTGDVFTTQMVDYRGYGYIGMQADNIKVGDDRGSEQSKNLRKAIATVLSVYRDVVIDSYYGELATIINYPISNTSWAAPQKSDADYKVAFSTDVNGNPIYTDGMTEDEKYAAALEAALGFFEAAGYTVEDGKLTAAPEGAKLSYEAMIVGGGNGDHPSFGIFTAASEALATIGFDLVVNDLSDFSIMTSAVDASNAELFCMAWQASLDPDMYQVYHSNGGSAYTYGIYSEELDALVMEGKKNTDQAVRKAIYKEALDFVVDYAVEIPIYQRQDSTVFSTQRVNIDTLVKDATTNYSWLNEIEKVQMN